MSVSIVQALPLALNVLSQLATLEGETSVLASAPPGTAVPVPDIKFNFGGVAYTLKANLSKQGPGASLSPTALFGLNESSFMIALSIVGDIDQVVTANPGTGVAFPPLRFNADGTHYVINYAVGRPDTGTASVHDSTLTDFSAA